MIRPVSRMVFALIAMNVFGSLGTSTVHAADGPGESKPNILFVFADDQCYQTVHALGCGEIQTPNLDRLVRDGLTFTHAYNQGSWSGAVCIASRTMLNTGRFLWHAQRVYNSAEQERQAGRFWSEYLRGAGYDTYFTGKWHVPADAEAAFDFVTHVRPGMPNQTPAGYNRPVEGQADPWKPWDKQFEGYWKGGRHWSEVLGDDAVAFLEQASQRDKPFFMYLAFNAPHDPRQSPRAYVDRYPLNKLSLPVNFQPLYPYRDAMGCGRDLRDEQLAPFPRTPYAVKVHRQEYYSIITHMDAQLGRILDALERSGKRGNTYIFFTADHGLAVGQHGLLGKQNMYDHSVRVPLLVVGPGIKGATTVDKAVYLQDIMPTTLELARVPVADHVEFKSLMPLIRGEEVTPYPAIYGAYLRLQRMVTEGDFKLILYPKIARALLYNVRQDPHEMTDLSEDPQYLPTMQRLFARLLSLQAQTGDELDLTGTFPRLAVEDGGS